MSRICSFTVLSIKEGVASLSLLLSAVPLGTRSLRLYLLHSYNPASSAGCRNSLPRLFALKLYTPLSTTNTEELGSRGNHEEQIHILQEEQAATTER